MQNINEFRPQQPSSAISSLARESFEQGRFAEAERLYRILAATLSRVLGSRHIETAMAKHNLAQCLSLQGKKQESHALAQEISEIFTDLQPMKSKDYFEPEINRKKEAEKLRQK